MKQYKITYYRGGKVDFRGTANLIILLRAVWQWARRGDCDSIEIRK